MTNAPRVVGPLLKGLAGTLATVAVLPACGVYRALALLLGESRVFPGWSQGFSLVPGLLGVYIRRAFYRHVLARCSSDCCVSFGTVFSHSTAVVGRRVYVGVGCGLGDVELGDDVLIGSHVSIINGGRQHGIGRLDIPIREQTGTYPRVRVGADSWIGDRSLVMADVGAHCVVGGGSVVTRPVPDYAIAVGNPARVVRYRTGASPRNERSADEPVGPAFGKPPLVCSSMDAASCLDL